MNYPFNSTYTHLYKHWATSCSHLSKGFSWKIWVIALILIYRYRSSLKFRYFGMMDVPFKNRSAFSSQPILAHRYTRNVAIRHLNTVKISIQCCLPGPGVLTCWENIPTMTVKDVGDRTGSSYVEKEKKPNKSVDISSKLSELRRMTLWARKKLIPMSDENRRPIFYNSAEDWETIYLTQLYWLTL